MKYKYVRNLLIQNLSTTFFVTRVPKRRKLKKNYNRACSLKVTLGAQFDYSYAIDT